MFPAVCRRYGPGIYPTQVPLAPTHQNGLAPPPPPCVSRADLLQVLASATLTASATSTSNGISGSGPSATTMSAHATYSNVAPMNYVPLPPGMAAGPSSSTDTVLNAGNHGASADASDSKIISDALGLERHERSGEWGVPSLTTIGGEPLKLPPFLSGLVFLRTRPFSVYTIPTFYSHLRLFAISP
ncbi:hypothetical protein PM082_018145 [Marasmius tenuissimus]|nr:hypothetical protein PM082_018145 [Marasmius tenuissimus]